MHILIGLGLALALLYFWLIGHWFARVLIFIGIGAPCAIAGLLLLVDGRQDAGAGLLLALVGAALAWPIAAIPTWCQQRRIDRMLLRRQ